MSDTNTNTGAYTPRETLTYHKSLLKQVNWLIPEATAPSLPLLCLGRAIQKIVRNLNPNKPTILKLSPKTELVILTLDQYESILETKRAFEQIIKEEERILADVEKKLNSDQGQEC